MLRMRSQFNEYLQFATWNRRIHFTELEHNYPYKSKVRPKNGKHYLWCVKEIMKIKNAL